MDEIKHESIEIKGLKLHIAEIGSVLLTGERVVVLLHGFPEIWYTWRHQMIAFGNAGYRVIASDFQGYGLSEKLPSPDTTTFSDLVHDLLGIVDHLALSKVFLIAKDFGIRVACMFAILHPDRVLGLVTLRLPYVPRGRSNFLEQLPKGNYISRCKIELPIAEDNQDILDLVDSSEPLPPWLSEDDIAYYRALYEKSGFETTLQVPYRSLNEEFVINDPVLKVPSRMIMGGDDYSWKFLGVREYIGSGQVNQYIPNLEVILLPEGCHFVHEQLPEVVNRLIFDFLANNT